MQFYIKPKLLPTQAFFSLFFIFKPLFSGGLGLGVGGGEGDV